MGLLRKKNLTDTDGVFIRAQHTIGRDADNDTVIPRPSISSRHATLMWTTSGWIVKDTSKYGTIVNGAVVRGQARALKALDELTFVEADEVWVLADASPPGLMLTPDNGPAIHVDYEAGLRAFPSEENPRYTVLRVGEAWFMEDDAGERRKLVNDAVVRIEGVDYRVAVPIPVTETAEPDNPASPFSLDSVELEITVMRGEDEAELLIKSGAVERLVKASRPLYLLAYLAEQRAKSPADGGWLPTDLVCSDLGVDRTVLNVDVHRVRESVKATSLVDGANIVERRPSQLRIAIPPTRYRVVRR